MTVLRGDFRSRTGCPRPFPRCALQLLLVAACLLSSTAPLEAAAPAPGPGIDGKWRHYSSPNFELYSRNYDDESRQLLHNLEILRAVFLERLRLDVRLRLGVTVYYFRTKEDFQAYAPESMRGNDEIAGFHLFRPDRAVISMPPTDNYDAAREVIFHEYVHHLFRIAEFDPPLWFNEGTADVLAGMQVGRKEVQIGTPLLGRVPVLRNGHLLPLDQLFSADQRSKVYSDEKHTGMFYAQSWALLHYWYFGNSSIRPEAVQRFLAVAGNRETAAKADLPKLFAESFGCDYAEMGRRLENYVRSGTYRAGRHPMPKVPSPSSYAARAVPVEEIRVRLAELALRANGSAAAKLTLLHAATADPGDPRPLEALGTNAFLEEDFQAAGEYWQRALDAGSQNPAVIRELALLEGRTWLETYDDSFRLPPERLARLRSRLLTAIKAEPKQTAAYEMLAWVESFAPEPSAANVNLVLAQLPAMPDKERTLIALSLVMLRVGKPDAAIAMLDHLETQRLDPQESHALNLLRLRLHTDYPATVATTEPKTNAAIIAPPPDQPGLKMPSVKLPDDL